MLGETTLKPIPRLDSVWDTYGWIFFMNGWRREGSNSKEHYLCHVCLQKYQNLHAEMPSRQLVLNWQEPFIIFNKQPCLVGISESVDITVVNGDTQRDQLDMVANLIICKQPANRNLLFK